MLNNKIIKEDFEYIFNNLENKNKFQDSTILITGCAGFLGFYFLSLSGFILGHIFELLCKKT